MDFKGFYTGIHQRAPFPWQLRLAAMVAAGSWPDALHLPTSAGKTALIDVWLWARAQGWAHVPRRLYYLIDRRQLVDAAAAYATNSIVRAGLDVAVVRLRGGAGASEDEWMLDPGRSSIISTTVDQLGSRILGRAYGVGRFSAAIHAGLAGNDALIVIDEAHLVEPLRQTLSRVTSLRQRARSNLGLPWHVVTMTATPVAGGNMLGLGTSDYKHPVLARRFGARKFTSLHMGGKSPAATFALLAVALRDGGARVVGVVVNRVALAREVHDLLVQRGEALLLTGRTRPHEREALGAELVQRTGTQSRAGEREPLYVVATQTIEVGLDLDFDALVTEIAPVSALRQRFGRLDRLGTLGTSHAAVVATEGTALPYSRSALEAAHKWLKRGVKSVKGVGKVIDLGVNAVSAMPAPPEEGARKAPWLLPADLDLLFDVDVPMDVEPYLHGEIRRADLAVAWRAELDGLEPAEWADLVERRLPRTEETMPLPVRAARLWLGGQPADAGDLETEPADDVDATAGGPAARGHRMQLKGLQTGFVVWDGEAARLSSDLEELRPGMLVVLPASAGGYDRFGWAPGAVEPVTDLMATGAVVARKWRGDNTRTAYAVGLATHLRGVGEVAERIAAACGLDTLLIGMLGQAGRLHDLGKNDPRFQLLLGAAPNLLLAKSGEIDPRITREFAGLPRGWRHEIASVAARPAMAPLVRYLVGSHHGRGKPWLPAAPDLALWRGAAGVEWPALHRDMVLEYGWWGLAFLEAILRIADWARSAQEQEDAEMAVRDVAA